MALPKLLQKLFANSGAGPLLRSDIIPVDSALSATSTNAVQNKAVKTALETGLSTKADSTALSGYLPLSGGTMTGAIINGTSGPTIRNYYEDGGSVKCLARSTEVCSSYSDYNKGATLILRSKTYANSQAGRFYLFARDPAVTDDGGGGALEGRPDGTLNWFSKHVLRLTNFNYNTTAGTWYRKYSDGFIEQGGWNNTKYGDTTFTITLPVAMSNLYYTVMLTKWGKGESIECQHANMDLGVRTTTSFTVHVQSSYKTGYTYTQWRVCGF